MNFHTLAFFLALLITISLTPAAAQQAAFRDGVVLVGFKQGIPAARQHSVIASAGAAELRTSLAGAHVLRVAPGRVQSVIQALRALPEVRYAEPDYVAHPDGVPNDPSFNLQWGFQNIGQSVNGTTGAPGADERAVAAWNITVGNASTVVAVTDTGVDYTHPDLAPNMWSNPGGVNNCPAGTHGYNVLTSVCDPMDDDTQYGGHGTHVAGIIGAASDNGVGVAGVNWVASIMGLKWINSKGTGYTSDLITALDWVVNAKQAGVNVRIVNDSATWGGTAFSQALSDTIDLLGSNDILFVTAAGNTAQNNDTTPRYPCVYDRPNQLCVAASDQTDHLWSSSNWGATTVNLAAPGVHIYSTLIGSYGFISGGSMACAQTSGTAALMLSLGYQPVGTLRTNILNAVDVLSSLSGLVATSGRLNVCKALPGCPDTATTTPVNTAAPAILGAAQQGQTLSSIAGTWSGGPASYSFQWNRCTATACAAIFGATAPTYTLMAAADIGATITLTVTASNSLGSGSAASAATAAVTSAPPVSWTVTTTIKDGQTLSGKVQWQAFVSIVTSNISAVEYYIDGTQSWTERKSPYFYNGDYNYLDTSTLSPGTHVFAVKAIATDASVAYYTARASTSGTTPVTISTASLPNGEVSVSYSATLTAGGGTTPYTWSITAGSLPAGLTLAPSTGVISGTPTTAGTSNFTVQVADKNSQTATKALSITINPLPTITTASLPNGGVSVAYSATLAASGGTTPYTWSITSGSLPAGLALAAGTGVISGTPTTAGTNNFTVQVTDKNSQTATQVLSITINPPPAITTTSLLNGTVNVAYSATLTAGGGTTPYTWSITSGSLPAGLALAPSNGVISGTPTTAATSSFTAQVTDTNAQTATQALSITINAAPAAPTITTASLPNGEVSVSYSATLTASGGTTPYTWSIAAGSLPAGLALAPSTGVISGTPTTAATSSFTAQVTDKNSQTATKALSITIDPPPAITTTSLPNGTVNAAYSVTLAASGGATPYTWSITAGSLPAGLTLAPSTGVISGTPTTAGTSNFTVQVADANSQTATKALSITINTSGGGATIALVQSAAVQGSGVASVAQAFANNNTAGNLIIAFVRMSTTSQTVIVTDSAGNAYVDAVSQPQTTDGSQTHIFYASGIKSGANTVTATFPSTNNHPWLAIYEYSGVSTLDQTAHAQGSNSSPNSGLTAATTSSSELVFAGLGLPSSSSVTVTAGSGYAMGLQDTIQFGSRAATEQAISTATGAYAGSFSLSAGAYWSCVVATFK